MQQILSKIYRSGWCNFHKTDDHSSSEGTWNAHGIARILIDSMAYENVKTQVTAAKPDVVEVLPGMMPKVIGKICKDLPVPVIAGGMIREKEDVMALLKAGVTSVSSTNPEIWFE